MQLRHKIAVTASAFVLLATAALSLKFHSLISDYQQQTLDSSVQQNNSALASDINHWLNGKLALVRNFAQASEANFQRQNILDLMSLAHLKDEFNLVYVGFDNETGLHNNGNWQAPANYDFHQRPFYTHARQNPGVSLTEPYIDVGDGKTILSAVVMVSGQDDEAILGADFSLETIQNALKSMDYNQTGYAFLISGNNKIITHPDKEWVGKPIGEFVSTGSSLKLDPSLQSVTVADKQYLVSFQSVGLKEVDWYIGAMIEQDLALASVNETRNVAITFTVIAVVISCLLLMLALKLVLKPLEVLTRAIQEVSSGDGDLTRRLKFDGNDEFAVVARHFNSFVERIQSLVQKVVQASGKITAGSGEISQGASGAGQALAMQLQEVEQLATAMNEMTSTAADVAQNAQKAAESASQANQSTSQGEQVVANTADTIQALADEVNRALESVNLLEKHSENIESIVEVINGIAEQTNLLALNAAIEAARAGEQGRGFAVVADEVRSLASRTQDSTKEIQNMVLQLKEGTSQAVKVMRSGHQQAEVTVAESEKAREALHQIKDAINQISEQNLQIASAAEEQSAVSEEINRNTLNIRELSQKISEKAQGSVAQSDALSDEAEQQKNLLSQFKV